MALMQFLEFFNTEPPVRVVVGGLACLRACLAPPEKADTACDDHMR